MVSSRTRVPDIYAQQTHTFGGEMLNQHVSVLTLIVDLPTLFLHKTPYVTLSKN